MQKKQECWFTHFGLLGIRRDLEEINKTIDFAMNSGADSFSFAILVLYPGHLFTEKLSKKIWWGGRSLDDMLLDPNSKS